MALRARPETHHSRLALTAFGLNEMSLALGHYPVQVPIDSYGNGGFRFAEMSHRGSVLCLPSGIWAWNALAPEHLTLHDLNHVLDEATSIDVLLLGTGLQHVMPPVETRAAFAAVGIGLEAMSTGSAARTYNIMLAERRKVAAALIAVS